MLARIDDYDKAMLNWLTCPVVESDPQKLGGAWVFKKTRVPVATLFEYIQDGFKIDEFLDSFPSVTREQVDGVLEHSVKSLMLREAV